VVGVFCVFVFAGILYTVVFEGQNIVEGSKIIEEECREAGKGAIIYIGETKIVCPSDWNDNEGIV